jgi:hypothetical protein
LAFSPTPHRFASIEKFPQTSGLVYKSVDAHGKTIVSKIIPGHAYPLELHKELAEKGLALTPTVAQLPGNFTLLETEFLAPSEGWMRLDEFRGNVDALETACSNAVACLHSCLDGRAVHGDLRPPNIFAR